MILGGRSGARASRRGRAGDHDRIEDLERVRRGRQAGRLGRGALEFALVVELVRLADDHLPGPGDVLRPWGHCGRESEGTTRPGARDVICCAVRAPVAALRVSALGGPSDGCKWTRGDGPGRRWSRDLDGPDAHTPGLVDSKCESRSS